MIGTTGNCLCSSIILETLNETGICSWLLRARKDGIDMEGR
jgi:hypothetical protein